MESILKAYDCCKCEKCVNDMMALALNSTKPAYVNTDEGVLFKRINSTLPQTTTDIDIAVVKAVEMVSGNPKHPPLPPEPAPAPETPAPAEESAPAEEKPAPAKKSSSAGKKSSAKKAAAPEEDTETEKPAAKKSSAGKKAAAKKTEEAETDKPETAPEAQMELF